MAERYVAKPAGKDSPYYYGTDSTYTPKVRSTKIKQVRPQYEIGLDGIPKAVPSKATQVENPTQNPERPTTPGNGGAIYGALPATVNQNLGAYDSSVTLPGMTRGLPADYKETEQQAGAKAETHRAGAGFGSEQRVSPTGVVQKGTSTSPAPMTMKEANSLLSDGYTMRNPFNSTQLPASSQSPYANVGPIADGAEYARNLEMQKPGAVTGVGPIVDGEQFAKNVEAAGQVVEKSIPKRPSGARQAAKWDRKYGGADFSGKSEAPATSGFDMDRRKAFFSGESSLQGLRNMESQMGISYAGGQHRMVNPNATPDGKNDFITVDNKDDIRGYKSGRLSAQDMKDKYVTKIVDNGIASYDEDKVSNTAGPVADGEAYGKHLQTQQAKYKTSGVGPLADGDAYAKMLRR
jgi:hypothetical protein